MAVLKLQGNIEFKRDIRPVCLPSKKISSGKTGELACWGGVYVQERDSGDGNIYSRFKMNDYGRKVQVQILTNEQCSRKNPEMKFLLTELSFCAGGEYSEFRYGESGGGLYVKIRGKFYLQGLLSATTRIPDSEIIRYVTFSDTFKYKKFLEDNGVLTVDPDETCGSSSIASGLSSGGKEIKRGSYPW